MLAAVTEKPKKWSQARGVTPGNSFLSPGTMRYDNSSLQRMHDDGTVMVVFDLTASASLLQASISFVCRRVVSPNSH